MSISYESLVEAVGPPDLIAKFKALILDQVKGPASPGFEQINDTPNYISFLDLTSGSALEMNRMGSVLSRYALQKASPIQGIVLRAEIATDYVNCREWVIGDNQLLFSMSSELDQVTAPTEENPYPLIVHSKEGDPAAWGRALAAYGVEQTHVG